MEKHGYFSPFFLHGFLLVFVIPVLIGAPWKQQSPTPQQLPSFDDMLNDVDFQELVKQIEKEIQIEQQKALQRRPHQPQFQQQKGPRTIPQPPLMGHPRPPTPFNYPEKQATPIKQPESLKPQATTPFEIFRQGIIPPRQEKQQPAPSTPLAYRYKKAFHTVFEELIMECEKIERFVLGSPTISPAYKQSCARHQSQIDKLVREYEAWGSHDAYIQYFLNQSEKQRALRNMIIRAHQAMKSLGQHLQTQTADHESIQKFLRQRADTTNKPQSRKEAP